MDILRSPYSISSEGTCSLWLTLFSCIITQNQHVLDIRSPKILLKSCIVWNCYTNPIDYYLINIYSQEDCYFNNSVFEIIQRGSSLCHSLQHSLGIYHTTIMQNDLQVHQNLFHSDTSTIFQSVNLSNLKGEVFYPNTLTLTVRQTLFANSSYNYYSPLILLDQCYVYNSFSQYNISYFNSQAKNCYLPVQWKAKLTSYKNITWMNEYVPASVPVDYCAEMEPIERTRNDTFVFERYSNPIFYSDVDHLEVKDCLFENIQSSPPIRVLQPVGTLDVYMCSFSSCAGGILASVENFHSWKNCGRSLCHKDVVMIHSTGINESVINETTAIFSTVISNGSPVVYQTSSKAVSRFINISHVSAFSYKTLVTSDKIDYICFYNITDCYGIIMVSDSSKSSINISHLAIVSVKSTYAIQNDRVPLWAKFIYIFEATIDELIWYGEVHQFDEFYSDNETYLSHYNGNLTKNADIPFLSDFQQKCFSSQPPRGNQNVLIICLCSCIGFLLFFGIAVLMYFLKQQNKIKRRIEIEKNLIDDFG